MQLPITRDGHTLFEPRLEPPAAQPPEPALRTHRRFDRAARLLGEPGLHRLLAAHVVVVGVGGVGSFAAEALARSGVGRITLVDFDKVCVTNSNRQLHAMQGTIGRRKVEVMAERLRLIHPGSVVEPLAVFYGPETSERVLDGPVDWVLDAIDNQTAKAHLLDTCLRRGLRVASSMGAAARLDPTQVRVADLVDTYRDPFASKLRKILRTHYGRVLERGKPLGVPAVFSTELARAPAPLAYDEGEGFRCVCPGGTNGMHDCERRARIDGSAAFVTGAFGLALASLAVRGLTDQAL